MKMQAPKALFVFSASLLLAHSLMNAQERQEVTTQCEGFEWEVKARGSAFIPTSHLFREIYGTAAGNFDAEFAFTIRSYLQVWANVDYTRAHGNSLGFCNPTSIQIINGSFGLKAPYDIKDWLAVYLGIGPTFGSIRIKDESQFTGCSSCAQTSAGFVAKTGVDFFFAKRFFVDVFADYVYQKAQFQQHVDASGLRIGAGLGVTF